MTALLRFTESGAPYGDEAYTHEILVDTAGMTDDEIQKLVDRIIEVKDDADSADWKYDEDCWYDGFLTLETGVSIPDYYDSMGWNEKIDYIFDELTQYLSIYRIENNKVFETEIN